MHTLLDSRNALRAAVVVRLRTVRVRGDDRPSSEGVADEIMLAA